MGTVPSSTPSWHIQEQSQVPCLPGIYRSSAKLPRKLAWELTGELMEQSPCKEGDLSLIPNYKLSIFTALYRWLVLPPSWMSAGRVYRLGGKGHLARAVAT
ncbi:hypothetical protein BsWGS_17341 [Bradybaena similaris]